MAEPAAPILPPSGIELWVEDGKKGMENALPVGFYNNQRTNQALRTKTPAVAFALAA